MTKVVSPFSSASVTAIAKVLGDTEDGLTGSEITQLLAECQIAETEGPTTKWKRIFNGLALRQNELASGNHVVAFINKAVNPARHTSKKERYDLFVDRLTPILSLSALAINDSGKLTHAAQARSLNEAIGKASKLKDELERRRVHKAVLEACQAELLVDNYFHAVLESMKGIGERMRDMSGSTSDGAALVNEMFSVGEAINPFFAINPLSTQSEISEQKGFVNLVIGMFGMFRNPTAHSPRMSWPMTEADAADMMATMSLVHRKLDNTRRRRMG